MGWDSEFHYPCAELFEVLGSGNCTPGKILEFPGGPLGPIDIMKALLCLAVALSLGLGTSCTTAYDSYGRPMEVVTPEGAALAAVAAGVIGYAIGDHQDRGHHYRGHGYSRGGYSRGGYGYGGYGDYCR